jgi:hypothetical protein
VLDAQACFRAVLEAMSRPGRVQVLTAPPEVPPGLSPAAAAVLLTLVDADTKLALNAGAAAEAWVRFHCAPVLAPRGEARFVLALYSLPEQLTKLSEAVQQTYSQYGNLATLREPLKNSFRLTLTRFANPAGLRSMGGNIYEETPASGTPESGQPAEQSFGSIMQGYTEGSNVNIVEEMVNLIIAQRAYEINSKSIQTSDEMLQNVANMKK